MPNQESKKSYEFFAPKVFIRTFGCQMNERDSEIIYGLMMDRGWKKAESADEADCVLINTCSVRHHAEQRAYSNMGMLAKLKRRKPHLVLGFVGCTAEKDKEIVFKRLPHVDLVVGPSSIYEIPDCIEEALGGRKKALRIGRKVRPEHDNPVYHEDSNRAYISISEGCDNFCSYCIVPYVRGRQRSRPADAIINEIRLAAKTGISEITLLGQNVNSYAKDIEAGYNFTDLLKDVAKIDGVKRIRFVTCHPKDTKEELFRAMRDMPKVHRHIHLPLQSGSAAILKAMKRGYTSEHYLDLVEKLRKYMPDCNLTTDIIVGFPGESDKDFKDTLNIMKKIKFDSAYIFKYSPRPPAESCELEDDVTEDVKKKRHAVLLDEQKIISKMKSGERESHPLPMA
ncbi:MAG: tRNA (N6-isopentenyl adenosine(37)-C2)-methylthiotransferase MiaB [Candidatus Omnitrophica bacterium]|nr:tRNA (N6-isopentenyl adenosine(37)-C2)-methylthiotransferase MiaB [Candidatus Omnitrophota bacterium]MBU4487446.1 tRNA (N6-isopentenyl adenosine(37)-C2)-methylthiotransferase MiaB [Candidatus Omnitrophota bacterium]MCG2705092.1 tRNA (N6-isopentenyl adenosine(37)-C2)-methylthiotransferase MiaB [Candidatus Omnitrophota bacterium]